MNMEGTAVAEKSIWGIIGDVFLAPTKAFEAFKQKPTWLIPLIIIMVLSAAAGGIAYKQNAMGQWDMMSTSTTLPPQIRAQMERDAINPSPVGAVIGGAVALPIITLISALIAWGLGSFVFGAKGVKYSHVWGAILLANLIPIAGGLLRSFLVVAKDSMWVSIGPAALMAGKNFTSLLYAILYMTDVFAIWGIIVAGFAFASIFSLSRGKGMAISIILFLFGLALFIGGSYVGFAFGGVSTSFI